MYDFTPLFLYKFQFMAELLVAEVLMCIKLKRRPFFALRAALCIAACFAFAFAVPVVAYNAVWCSAMFIILFAFTVPMLRICFAESWATVVFCSLAGYTMQHIAYELFDLIIVLTGLNGGESFGNYGDGEVITDPRFGGVGGFIFTSNLLVVAVWLLVYVWTYWTALVYAMRKTDRGRSLELRHLSLLVVVAMIVIVDVVSSSFVTYYSVGNFDTGYVVALYLYNIFCCVLAMYIQFAVALRRKLERDYDALSRLWEQKKEQYEITKENIELVNMKCHDLRHQLRTIAGRESVSADAIDEMEQVIDIYDSVVKTGNDALDIILTEKSLLCNRRKIRLSCMADGSRLSFMSDADLYALFGNLTDNAIEAVKDLPVEKRTISLSIREVKGFLSVNIHNLYEGSLAFENGLPVTTKSDAVNHGYGMKSVRMICLKYGGEMTVKADGGAFNLNLIFPVSKRRSHEYDK